MKNIVIESRQEATKKYIPAIAFLLGIPAGIASAFLVQANTADFAQLNQFVNDAFFPTAEASMTGDLRELVTVLVPDAKAGINFQGDGAWTNQDGSYTVSDDDSDDSC